MVLKFALENFKSPQWPEDLFVSILENKINSYSHQEFNKAEFVASS